MKKFAWLDDSSLETLKGPSRSSHILFLTVILFFTCALFWSSHAVLDEVTSGEGKVIPSTEIQIIQHLEGGIINKIFITQGEIVKKNQPLMQIDDTRVLANYKELTRKVTNLEIDIFRLNAQIDNKPFIVPSDIIQRNPDLYRTQTTLYGTKLNEIKELRSSLDLVNRELVLTKPLVQSGSVSEVEVLRIQRLGNEIRSKLLAFKSKSLGELNKAKADLNVLKESIGAGKDTLTRTIVRSPINGIIKQIRINTLGGIIKPGMDILEIIPLDDTLLIEAKIRPADIGFIQPNQNAMVKITAYDFSIYGGLEGKIEQISADTIKDEGSKNDESHYLIRVRTKRNYIGSKKNPLYIIPGMLARVDILTGEKTVLDYLLKPIMKARERALRER